MSLLFYGAHLSHAYATLAFVPFFLAYSVLQGVLVLLTGSILPGILLHFLGDVILLPMQYGVVPLPYGTSWMPYLISALLLGGGAFLAFRRWRTRV